MESQTRYGNNDGVNIAYQVHGEGPLDLILVPGWVSHVEFVWEVDMYAAFLRRLASFCRFIMLDRRGTGLSDPADNFPTLEQRMEDERAVKDDAGSEKKRHPDGDFRRRPDVHLVLRYLPGADKFPDPLWNFREIYRSSGLSDR